MNYEQSLRACLEGKIVTCYPYRIRFSDGQFQFEKTSWEQTVDFGTENPSYTPLWTYEVEADVPTQTDPFELQKLRNENKLLNERLLAQASKLDKQAQDMTNVLNKNADLRAQIKVLGKNDPLELQKLHNENKRLCERLSKQFQESCDRAQEVADLEQVVTLHVEEIKALRAENERLAKLKTKESDDEERFERLLQEFSPAYREALRLLAKRIEKSK